jgi:hypothetical protein
MNVEDILLNYNRVAGPLLQSLLDVNACIAATRVTVDCLKRWDLEVVAKSVKWMVSVPKLERAYAAGFSQEELVTAKELSDPPWRTRDSWRGHLVAMLPGYLIDSSFNQAAIGLGLPTSPSVAVFPLPDVGDLEILTYSGTTDDGHEVLIQYHILKEEQQEKGWKDSAAWNDPELAVITTMIDSRMRKPRNKISFRNELYGG